VDGVVLAEKILAKAKLGGCEDRAHKPGVGAAEIYRLEVRSFDFMTKLTSSSGSTSMSRISRARFVPKTISCSGLNWPP
jgi:hypothetical protein